MSNAKRCDLCGEVFDVEKGVIELDVSIATGDKDGSWNSWGGVDFCLKCSKEIRKAIGSAIQE